MEAKQALGGVSKKSSVEGVAIPTPGLGACGHYVVPTYVEDPNVFTAEELRFPYLLLQRGQGWRPPQSFRSTSSGADVVIGPTFEHYVSIRLEGLFNLSVIDQRSAHGIHGRRLPRGPLVVGCVLANCCARTRTHPLI